MSQRPICPTTPPFLIFWFIIIPQFIYSTVSFSQHFISRYILQVFLTSISVPFPFIPFSLFLSSLFSLYLRHVFFTVLIGSAAGGGGGGGGGLLNTMGGGKSYYQFVTCPLCPSTFYLLYLPSSPFFSSISSSSSITLFYHY